MSFAFVPSNLGRAVSSRACPPGTGSGAALVRLAPANPHPLALALALAVQDDLLHASVPGYLVIQVGYVGLYSLTCMGACFSPAAAPNISLRPFGPDLPGPMKPCSLCCDRVCVCAGGEHGSMDRGRGRMNYGDRGNYRVQLRAVTEAGWNGTGRNGPYRRRPCRAWEEEGRCRAGRFWKVG